MMKNKKIAALIAAVSLMIAGGTINRVNIRIPLTVSAEEPEGAENNNEEPGGEEPEEPGEEPEEPGGEEPSENNGDPNGEPTEEPSEEGPEEGGEGAEATDASSESENEDNKDDEEDGNDTERPDGGNSPAGGGAVTSRKTSKTRVTTKGTTTETTVSAVTAAKNNDTGAVSVENKTGEGKLSAGRTFAAALAVAATIAAVAGVIVLRKKSKVKYEYYPGDDVDEANCPSGALEFNRKYGKYNASAVTEYEDRIILTFDPDYNAEAMGKILDVLKEKNVSAVFFINEKCLKEQPKLISRMIGEGHMIGNSGMTDASMPDMKSGEIIDSIVNLHEKLLKEYGYEMRYFRPPYGEYSKKTLAAARDLGYTTLMWSYEYINDLPDKGESIKDIVDCAHSGGVGLFRGAEEKEAAVLNDAIEILRSKGFEI